MRTWRALWAGLVVWAGVAGPVDAQVSSADRPAGPAPGESDVLWAPQAAANPSGREGFGQVLQRVTRPLSRGVERLLGTHGTASDPRSGGEVVSAAEAVASRVQAEEAGAAGRQAAVRYLATVDWHHYPEAELALVSALRCDGNESVRWEAARALGRGCCCTKDTLAALTLVVRGGAEDGNPAERSERVKAEAAYSLQVCSGRYRPHIPSTPDALAGPPGLPTQAAGVGPGPARVGVELTAYYTRQVPRASMARLVQDADRALAASAGTSQEPAPTVTARAPAAVGPIVPYEEAVLGDSCVSLSPRAADDRTGVRPPATSGAASARPPVGAAGSRLAAIRAVRAADAGAEAGPVALSAPSAVFLRQRPVGN
jgi:hypothetical protein